MLTNDVISFEQPGPWLTLVDSFESRYNQDIIKIQSKYCDLSESGHKTIMSALTERLFTGYRSAAYRSEYQVIYLY